VSLQEITKGIPKETCPLINGFQADVNRFLKGIDENEHSDLADAANYLRESIDVTESLRDSNYELRQRLEKAIEMLESIYGVF
jgi:hypothetical protein